MPCYRLPALLDELYHKLNAKAAAPADPDYGGEAHWWRVQAALTFHYDQIARAALGMKRRPKNGRATTSPWSTANLLR